MTHERDPRVLLADDVTRCEPSKPCQSASKCARYKAELPKQWARLSDFSMGMYFNGLQCGFFEHVQYRGGKR